MKKRLVMMALLVCMSVSLVACGGNASNKDTEKNNTENTQQDDTQANKNTEKESESEEIDDGKIEYRVKLVDASGNPVVGEMVQVCNAATCFAPQVTDANGIATFRLEESNEYKAKLLKASDDAYVYFNAGSTELTLTIAE